MAGCVRLLDHLQFITSCSTTHPLHQGQSSAPDAMHQHLNLMQDLTLQVHARGACVQLQQLACCL